MDWVRARHGFTSANNVALHKGFHDFLVEPFREGAFKFVPLYMILVDAIVVRCNQTGRSVLGIGDEHMTTVSILISQPQTLSIRNCVILFFCFVILVGCV